MDPVTGEIIRSGDKASFDQDTNAAIAALKEKISERDEQIKELEKELDDLKRKCLGQGKVISKIAALVSDVVEE